MSGEKQLDRSNLEIAVGLTMMISSWLTILLIAIEAFTLPGPYWIIAISILCYVLSVIGLGLSTHGLYTRLYVKVERRKKRVQP